MKHNNKFNVVKKYYNLKMWNEDRVRNAVVKNWITTDEFKEIVGVDY